MVLEKTVRMLRPKSSRWGGGSTNSVRALRHPSNADDNGVRLACPSTASHAPVPTLSAWAGEFEEASDHHPAPPSYRSRADNEQLATPRDVLVDFADEDVDDRSLSTVRRSSPVRSDVGGCGGTRLDLLQQIVDDGAVPSGDEYVLLPGENPHAAAGPTRGRARRLQRHDSSRPRLKTRRADSSRAQRLRQDNLSPDLYQSPVDEPETQVSREHQRPSFSLSLDRPRARGTETITMSLIGSDKMSLGKSFLSSSCDFTNARKSTVNGENAARGKSRNASTDRMTAVRPFNDSTQKTTPTSTSVRYCTSSTDREAGLKSTLGSTDRPSRSLSSSENRIAGSRSVNSSPNRPSTARVCHDGGGTVRVPVADDDATCVKNVQTQTPVNDVNNVVGRSRSRVDDTARSLLYVRQVSAGSTRHTNEAGTQQIVQRQVPGPHMRHFRMKEQERAGQADDKQPADSRPGRTQSIHVRLPSPHVNPDQSNGVPVLRLTVAKLAAQSSTTTTTTTTATTTGGRTHAQAGDIMLEMGKESVASSSSSAAATAVNGAPEAQNECGRPAVSAAAASRQHVVKVPREHQIPLGTARNRRCERWHGGLVDSVPKGQQWSMHNRGNAIIAVHEEQKEARLNACCTAYSVLTPTIAMAMATSAPASKSAALVPATAKSFKAVTPVTEVIATRVIVTTAATTAALSKATTMTAAVMTKTTTPTSAVLTTKATTPTAAITIKADTPTTAVTTKATTLAAAVSTKATLAITTTSAAATKAITAVTATGSGTADRPMRMAVSRAVSINVPPSAHATSPETTTRGRSSDSAVRATRSMSARSESVRTHVSRREAMVRQPRVAVDTDVRFRVGAARPTHSIRPSQQLTDKQEEPSPPKSRRKSKTHRRTRRSKKIAAADEGMDDNPSADAEATRNSRRHRDFIDMVDDKRVKVDHRMIVDYLKLVNANKAEYEAMRKGELSRKPVRTLLGMARAYSRGHHEVGPPESTVVQAAYELGNKIPPPVCVRYEKMERQRAELVSRASVAVQRAVQKRHTHNATDMMAMMEQQHGACASLDQQFTPLQRSRAELEIWLRGLTMAQQIKAKDMALREMGEENCSIRKWWLSNKYCKYLRQKTRPDSETYK